MKIKTTTQANGPEEGTRARRVLPLFLSALLAAPNGPLVASAAAQVFNAEAAVSGAASSAAGASAFSGAARGPAPAALTPLTTPLSAPAFSGLGSAPATHAPAAAPAAAAPGFSAHAAAPSAAPFAASVAAATAFTASAVPAAEVRANGVPAESAAAPAGTLRAAAAELPSPAHAAGAERAAAPAETDASLARLFDGAKGYSADSVAVALLRADGKKITTTLSRLSETLKADPTLRDSVNQGGAVKLTLHPDFGVSVPTTMSADLAGYLRERGVSAPVEYAQKKAWWVGFDWTLLKDAPQLLRESWTVPNRQDYAYLAAKTFGLNLAVRAFFAATAVHHGDLPLMRAVISTSWYQLQDAGFTVFGQTYMKFIGRMTGLLRIGRSYFGDFLFTYGQLTAFEFINRLVLGPIGENPLVYTPHGLALIFQNVFMGMISGGPLIPAISKMRRAGVISQKTMMNLYQLASLTMQFGLLASFGYQHVYFLLTTATLILSWGSYAFFTLFTKDKPGIDTGMGAHKKP